MSQYNEGRKAFIAYETIGRYCAVKLKSASGTQVELAGSNEANIGFAEESVVSGEQVTVRLKNGGGTFKAVAHEAIAAGDTLYNHPAGRVGDTSTGTARYVALEAAAAQGDILEILPIEVY